MSILNTVWLVIGCGDLHIGGIVCEEVIDGMVREMLMSSTKVGRVLGRA